MFIQFRSGHYLSFLLISIFEFLINAQEETTVTVDMTTTTTTSSRSIISIGSRINEIQQKLLTMQSDITALNDAVSYGENPEETPKKFVALKDEHRSLKIILDDLNLDNGQTEDVKFYATLRRLRSFHDSLDEQLQNLEESINDPELIKEPAVSPEDRLTLDIINTVKSRNFAGADEKIIKLGVNSPKIRLIVHDVYANNIGNFDILLDYAKNTKQITISYHILSALWYEMKANNHMDVYKLIQVYRTFDDEVINQRNTIDDIRVKARDLHDQATRNAIVLSGAKTLAQGVNNGDSYENNGDIHKLANELIDLDEQIFDDVIHKTIDDVYDRTPKNTLVREMWSHQRIPQIAEALVYIFGKFQQRQHLDDAATMMIADFLKQLKQMENYPNLIDRKKRSVDDVLEKLPMPVKNLYFSEKVCFKNVHYSEYLYAPNYYWNVDRRYIFTWGTNEIVIQSPWFVRPNGEFTFEFENVACKNEYMFVGEYKARNERLRHVFTWVPGGSLNRKFRWQIDLHGNEVNIRNLKYNEFLCASDSLHLENRRYVYTVASDWNTKECRWIVESCN